MLNFCKPVSSKKRFSPHRQINEEFSFTLFDKAAAIPQAEWELIAGAQSIFLRPAWLSVIENCNHTVLHCRYVIIYQHQKPCGVIYYQVVDFRADLFGSLISREVEDIRHKKMNLFERYLDSNKDEVLLRLFTCGNNLVSGEHGYRFGSRISKEKAHDLLLTITELVSREEKLRGTISAVLLKDFYKPLKPEKMFNNAGYSHFSVEPNLVVTLPGHVRSLSDFIARFNKKYRKRAKNIFGKCEGIDVRELHAAEIEKLDKKIYALYTAVWEKAKFRLMQLPQQYFSRVKTIFGDAFSVKGFFSTGELVAFSSNFVLEDKSLEAHYIGFDYEANAKHELYQNILYTMIADGIAQGCTQVNLGRTAAEIKTTVGATPRDLLCYIKPQNTISRLIQRPFISFLQPAPWTPRNPFGEQAYAEKQETKQ